MSALRIDRGVVSAMRARLAWRPTSRSVAAAVAVGFALRLLWVIWTTRAPSEAWAHTDLGRYLTTATQLADHRSPASDGVPSAGTAIGYPLVLAPVVWLARQANSPSPAFAAALLNVGFGTATIVCGAALARAWFGDTAGRVAAWLIALAPGQIYFTSVAMSETLFAFVIVGGLLAASALVAGDGRTWVRGRRAAMGFGAFAGFGLLVNPGGMLLLLAPAMVVRGRSGAWRGAARNAGWLLAGALVILLPWTLRNGVQVGVWGPFPTSNALAICVGHGPGSDGTGRVVDAAASSRCLSGRPLLPGQTLDEAGQAWVASEFDESEWYYRNNRQAVAYAVSHPLSELRLSGLKLLVTLRDDGGALDAASGFGERSIGTTNTQQLLVAVGEAWYWLVLSMGCFGVAALASARRAVPIWGTALLSLAGILVIHGGSRYHHSIVVLSAVLASAALARIVRDPAADALRRLQLPSQ